jgi:hypothetical protein
VSTAGERQEVEASGREKNSASLAPTIIVGEKPDDITSQLLLSLVYHLLKLLFEGFAILAQLVCSQNINKK